MLDVAVVLVAEVVLVIWVLEGVVESADSSALPHAVSVRGTARIIGSRRFMLLSFRRERFSFKEIDGFTTGA